jgi:hypothetical protein
LIEGRNEIICVCRRIFLGCLRVNSFQIFFVVFGDKQWVIAGLKMRSDAIRVRVFGNDTP